MNLRTDDCTTPLIVQNMQVDTNVKAKVREPEPTLFCDTILVLKEAINAQDVYMNRSEATKNGDSGWYFGLLNDENEGKHDTDELVNMPSYELMKFRGEALRVLQMPVGTVAVFHENTMTALVDKDDNEKAGKCKAGRNNYSPRHNTDTGFYECCNLRRHKGCSFCS